MTLQVRGSKCKQNKDKLIIQFYEILSKFRQKSESDMYYTLHLMVNLILILEIIAIVEIVLFHLALCMLTEDDLYDVRWYVESDDSDDESTEWSWDWDDSDYSEWDDSDLTEFSEEE